MKYSLGISNFLEEIPSLSHSIVFFYFFALITEEGFLVSPCYSLELCIQLDMSFPFLSCLSLLLYPQLFVKPPQTTTLPPCISFSLGWFWPLPPIQCYEPLSIILQALWLPDLIPWICLLPPVYNPKESGRIVNTCWMNRSIMNGKHHALGFIKKCSWQDPLEEGTTTHSSIFAWRIPWTKERYGPLGHKESGITEAT